MPPKDSRVGLAPRFAKYRIAARVVCFIVLALVFYGFLNTPDPLVENSAAKGVTLRPYLQSVAGACGVILNTLGQSVSVSDTAISSDRFSMRIVRGCDATEPVALLIIAILAAPAAFRLKLVGVISGTALMLCINLMRLVTLFLVGTYMPSFFDRMHKEVLQAVLIVATVATWAAWFSWAKPREARVRSDSA